MAFKPPTLARNNLNTRTTDTSGYVPPASSPPETAQETSNRQIDTEDGQDEDDLFPSYSQEEMEKTLQSQGEAISNSISEIPPQKAIQESDDDDLVGPSSNGKNLENLVSLDYSFSDFAASCGVKTAIEAAIQDETSQEGSQSFFDEVANQSLTEKELSLKVNLEVKTDISSSHQLAKKSSPKEEEIKKDESSLILPIKNIAKNSRKRGQKAKEENRAKRTRSKKTDLAVIPKVEMDRTTKRGKRASQKVTPKDQSNGPSKWKSQRLKAKAEQEAKSKETTPNVKPGKEPVSPQLVPSYTGAGLQFRLFKLKKLRSAGTWVECCNTTCQKWRLLPDIKDPALIPEIWTCGMNPDVHHNKCDIPEEEHHKGSNIYVEANYTTGSMVWAKLQGFPWWPAFVDDDPDTERFFWTNGEDSSIVTRYHVVFFNRLDASVARAWIKPENILKFRGDDDFETIANLNKPLMANPNQSALLKARWDNALNLAKLANRLRLNKRRDQYCFMSRFKGSWSVPWELSHEAHVKEESMVLEE